MTNCYQSRAAPMGAVLQSEALGCIQSSITFAILCTSTVSCYAEASYRSPHSQFNSHMPKRQGLQPGLLCLCPHASNCGLLSVADNSCQASEEGVPIQSRRVFAFLALTLRPGPPVQAAASHDGSTTPQGSTRDCTLQSKRGRLPCSLQWRALAPGGECERCPSARLLGVAYHLGHPLPISNGPPQLT